jgi:molecular chaperone GrpE (heat shock protein)
VAIVAIALYLSGYDSRHDLDMISIHPESQAALRRLMKRVNLTSWRSLSAASGVSIGQIRIVRQAQWDRLTLGTIDRLAQALHCSRTEFLEAFEWWAVSERSNRSDASERSERSATKPDQASVLQAECDRLREALDRQASDLNRRFQTQAIDQLESFLTFWPVAADRARRDPSLPAIKLVPLLKPIEALLASWQVEAIGAIGQLTEFDPSLHQPISDQINSGDRVRVTHCGYRHGDRLLFRAKVCRDDGSE